jgi:hypothetical protein
MSDLREKKPVTKKTIKSIVKVAVHTDKDIVRKEPKIKKMVVEKTTSKKIVNKQISNTDKSVTKTTQPLTTSMSMSVIKTETRPPLSQKISFAEACRLAQL